MVVKKYLKVGIIGFFILLILISGIVMLRKLTHDKQVFEEDLYAYIPAETSSLFQINKQKDIKLFSSYFQEIKPVLLSISPYITYPLLISSCNNYPCIVAKVTIEQEQAIGKILMYYIRHFLRKKEYIKEHGFYFIREQIISFLPVCFTMEYL